MIEPVIATALILSILALLAYYLQHQQPHHQHHYYHQVARARVMADPQRRRSGGGVDRRGEEEVCERENEEGEGEGEDEGRGEVTIGVRELGMVGRGSLGSGLVFEGGGDVGNGKRLGAKTTGECCGSGEDGVDAALCYAPSDAFEQKRDIHTNTASQRPSRPILRLTIPDSEIPSTILPSHDAENGLPREDCYSNTLDQQRRQRVRFDEALRMHSFGGSQYVGRVVDKDAERTERGEEKKEMC